MIVALTTQAFRRHYVNLGEPTHQAVNHKIKLLRKDMHAAVLTLNVICFSVAILALEAENDMELV